MDGLTFQYDIFYWCGISIILNIIVFMLLKNVSKKNFELIITKNKKQIKEFNKLWKIIKMWNMVVWVIIFSVLVLFYGISWREDSPDMGFTNNQEEAIKYSAPSSEDITNINGKSLKEKKKIREKEVEKEQEESSKSYEEFIKQSLKDKY